jgi:hypothetical protein
MKYLAWIIRIVAGLCLGLSILAYPQPGYIQVVGPGSLVLLGGFYAWLMFFPDKRKEQAIGSAIGPILGIVAVCFTRLGIVRYWIPLTAPRIVLYYANVVLALAAGIIWILNRSALNNLKVVAVLVATFGPFVMAAWFFSAR